MCKRPVVVRRQKGVPDHLYVDSFCSNGCCRTWHGVPLMERKVRESGNVPMAQEGDRAAEYKRKYRARR